MQTQESLAKEAADLLDKCSQTVKGKSYQDAFSLASTVIRGLLSTTDIIETDHYQTGLDLKAGTMRILFSKGPELPVCYMILNTPQIYEFATELLQKYDKLEGIA